MRTTCWSALIFLSLHASFVFSLEIKPSETQNKVVGSNLLLTCTVSRQINRTGMLHLDWWNSGRKIEATVGRVHVERTNTSVTKLLISRLKISDSGSYRCTLMWAEIQIEKSVIVQVSAEGLFDENVDSLVEIGLGEDAVLQCGLLSFIRPSVTWKFNNITIAKPRSRKYQVDKKNNLVVRRVVAEDRGLYECKVNLEDDKLFGSRIIELRTLNAPENVKARIIGKVIEGQPVNVDCEAHGSKPLKFEWLKEQILSEKVRAKIPVVRQNSTLWLEKMKEDFQGKYFCRVSNSKGVLESSVELKMMRLPSINVFPTNRTILEGGPLVADCEATGDPIPLVLWTKLNSSTHIEVTDPKYGSSKLIIPKVETSDEGIYVCLATNEAGNESRKLILNVECIPKLHCEPESCFGWAGEIRMFTCISTGKPHPSVQWRRVGQMISDITHGYEVDTNNHSEGVTSVLRILIGRDQSWVFGAYSCLAQNKHGSTSIELKLLPAALPNMPHNVSVVSENGTSVVLKVSIEKCRPVVSAWRVEYRQNESNVSESQKLVSRGTDEVELLVPDLKEGREYVLLVSAGNEMGFGEPATIQLKTSPLEQPQGSSQLQQLNGEGNDLKVNFEILSGCFGAALAVVFSLSLLVYCLKKKRLCRRGDRSALNSGVRCYSWYNATSSAKIKNKPPLLDDDKTNLHSEISESRKVYASPELIHATLDDRETSLSLLRTRRKTSLKYSHTDATLSPEKVSIRTGTSALDCDTTDACSGVYEEIPKSDSTAVSEILDEYHVEVNIGNHYNKV